MNTLQKIKAFIIAHKIWTGIIIIAVIFFAYKIFTPKATAEIRYITTTVEKGTIVSSVTGSGQVESSSTIDLKPNVSANVVAVHVKPGQTVKKGETLFVLDAGDADKTLRNAELDLQVAENSLATAKANYANTQTSQNTALKNALLALNSDVVAVPDDSNTNTNIVTLSGSYTSSEQGRYTITSYACEGGICANYSGLESGTISIQPNIPKPLGTRGLFVSFSKVPSNNDKWYIDVPSKQSNTYATDFQSYSDKQESNKENLDSIQANIDAQMLAITQKENAIADAKQALSDYYVAAPFDGTMATVTAQVGQSSSSGTALGTIITNQKLATITLNEVDVAKIKVGQKATLTFDAIDGLSIAGEVAEIDSVGTVTQGVVNYTVKINLLTDDARIKPGMSVSASIITATAPDVLIVPSAAVKTNGNGSYVQMFATPLPAPDATTSTQGQLSSKAPEQVPVSIGISDDTSTEITSGLKEGDQIVARTITATAAKSTTAAAAPSLFGGTSTRGAGGGNAFRGAATTGR